VRHSSALRDPALAAPNFVGTDLTHDGVAVSLITSRMRLRISKDGRGIGGDLSDCNGWCFRFEKKPLALGCLLGIIHLPNSLKVLLIVSWSHGV
jgi:hypothetical protein